MTEGIRVAPIGCAAPLPATLARASAKVKRGLYDSYSSSASIANAKCQGRVSVNKLGRYGQPAGRQRSLVKPRCGRYSQRGGEIDFASGPWADLYGVETATTRLDVWAEGDQIKSWICSFKSCRESPARRKSTTAMTTGSAH